MGLESRCKGTTFFPVMQVFRPLFFIKFQIETYSSRNRVSDGGFGRQEDGFGAVFRSAVAVVAVVAVILKPITATADPPNLEGTYIYLYIYINIYK